MYLKFDIDITFQEIGNYFSLQVVYNPDVYERKMVEGLIHHYRQLLTAVLANPKEKVSQIDYLSEKEKQELLFSFNATEVAYPKDKTIVDIFEAQVKKTPDDIAVVYEDVELSYKELNERSNQLAHYIQASNAIKPDDLVGIKLERSEWMIISILGVLKSGAAYVPIDMEYPEERISFIENDSNINLCIDSFYLNEFFLKQKNYSKRNSNKINKPDDLAYVIYTSGLNRSAQRCNDRTP